MKFLLFLLSSLLLSRAHHEEELIEDTKQIMSDPMSWMVNMIKQDFLDENGDFKPALRGMMPIIESQFCPGEQSGDTCQNWLFGCKCVKEFSKLESSCAAKPCKLFRNFKENGPSSFKKIANAESYEEVTRTLTDFMITPVLRALCECPGMIGASINCVRKYDGQVFEMTGMEKAPFDNLVASIEWRALKSVLLGFIEAGCGEKNGKDCVTEFSDSLAAYGIFMDNGRRGEDVCLSLVRFQDEYNNYLNVLTSFIVGAESMKSFLSRAADAYLEMEKKVLCDPVCADEISSQFYSCCKKHAYQVLTTEQMKNKYNKLLKNLLTLFSDSDKSPRKLVNVINKFLSFTDPETFCGDSTDAYRLKNQECAALGI